ncbi:MAG TPA: hypothetical protein VKM55_05020 [Candidatus Lokiarchaeia archaeon]|nr:hypothetical protein [Candidatus Lokiarchaeia archaeon]
MRCPRCGNDILATQYTCHVCNTVLIVEFLETKIPLFRRHEERWHKPMTMLQRFKWIILNPSKAMWDIVHKPKSEGGVFLFFINALLFGLVGVVLYNKIDFSGVSIYGFPYSSLPQIQWLAGLSIYFAFVAYGIVYFLILWGFLLLAHTIAAKYILNINPRYGQQLGVMNWAFLPALVVTGVYILVLDFGLPTVSLGTMNLSNIGSIPIAIYSQVLSLYFSPRSLPTWIAADIVQIVYYFGYLSLLLAIAFREMYDKSTTKALISAIIAGIICATIFVLTRSSFAF